MTSTSSTATVEAPKSKKTSTPAAATENTKSKQRADLIRCLRKARAVDPKTALSMTKLSERMELPRLEVYHLVSGGSGKAGSSPTCLMATGHVKVVTDEEEGLSVHLTKAGVDTKFDDRPFVRSPRK